MKRKFIFSTLLLALQILKAQGLMSVSSDGKQVIRINQGK